MKRRYQIAVHRAVQSFRRWAREENPNIQMVLPLAEVVSLLQEGVGHLLREAGLALMQLVMEEEVRRQSTLTLPPPACQSPEIKESRRTMEVHGSHCNAARTILSSSRNTRRATARIIGRNYWGDVPVLWPTQNERVKEAELPGSCPPCWCSD